MQILTARNVQIEAIYGCLPSKEIDCLSICQTLYGEGASDVIKGTGIKKKRVVEGAVSSLDLCIEAAIGMFSDYPSARSDVQAIVCVTFTPERRMPANAIVAQSRLGLSNDCLAFDINLACSGYVYGVWLASTIANQVKGKVLLLDGDIQSPIVSPYDKGTLPVLSDAGSATLISSVENNDPWHFSFYTDGSKSDVLQIRAGGSRYPLSTKDLEYVTEEDANQRRNIDIYMNGFEIFKFVATKVSSFLRNFMAETQTRIENIRYFVPHQANVYMIRQLGKGLGFSPDKIWVSCDKYGNSGSATIPVTIADRFALTENQTDSRVLVSGFGAGLSISAGLVSLPADLKTRLLTYPSKE